MQEHHLLEPEQLSRIEQLARLHYDLEINLEGLEAISHLLDRMVTSDREARSLRERLRLYESEEDAPEQEQARLLRHRRRTSVTRSTNTTEQHKGPVAGALA